MIVGVIVGISTDIIIKNLVYEVYADTHHIENRIERDDRKEVRIKVVYDWTEEETKEYVYEAAEKYNTYPDRMWQTIKCENPELIPELQSLIVKEGVREDSWGLAQFYLPAGNKTPDGEVITKEIAQDPIKALDAMAWHFSEGRAHLWSCYKKIYM